MTLWLVRAGRDGENETLFAEENRVGVGLGVSEDIGQLTRDEIAVKYRERNPEDSNARVGSRVGQLWRFSQSIENGDYIVVPFKQKRAIRIAKVVGDYQFDRTFSETVPHTRRIEWVSEEIPRTSLDQDLLNTLGAIMTVCRIHKNDAENRILGAAGLKPFPPLPPEVSEGDGLDDNSLDLKERANDDIERLISEKFRTADGYEMERLAQAILEAQGYTVLHSEKGKDKGVDLLAASGPLGFGRPRICVQVKSGGGKTDTFTLDRLIGTMDNFNAEQGILISWGGFTKDVTAAKAAHFFKVRLWDKQDLIDELLESYEKLNSDIKAELPLKQIWTTVQPE